MATSHSTAPPMREEEEDGIMSASASASETTPLLASSTAPVTAAGDPEDAKAIVTSTSSQPSSKPLPKLQIFLLCYARLIEPVAFFSIFPYINQMVLANGHGSIAEKDMGFYSGLIESLFSLTQMLVMVFWGRAADRVGRKPVLVFSLLGVVIATALFGLAKSITQMILFRCLAGVFAGTIVTIRAMISEHSTKETQARAFSWFAFAGNLGILTGPLLGGALADPAGQYPGSVFGRIAFFKTYPYALSSFVVAGVGFTAFVTSALFVEETLHIKRASPSAPKTTRSSDGNSDGNNEAASQSSKPAAPTSTRALLRSPGVGIVLYNYGHVMLLAYAYTAIVPVFWSTSVSLGGLGLTPLQISLFMGLNGLSQAIWVLVFFPPLQHRIGTNGVMRACGTAYPVSMAVMPCLNAILRLGSPASKTVFYVFGSLLWLVFPGVSMAFTAVQLALNDVSPSHETLGMLNALALTLISGLRSFSPALFASLFALGAGNQLLGGYFIWLVMTVLAAGFTVATRFLPEAGEDAVEGEEEGA
ncbi:MFS general substrate transporter [Xylariaceae sp. FL0594]|nr:MFS general substrate transporter [Xylariaceae sp. FL0594]